jgi:hypothetical protein
MLFVSLLFIPNFYSGSALVTICNFRKPRKKNTISPARCRRRRSPPAPGAELGQAEHICPRRQGRRAPQALPDELRVQTSMQPEDRKHRAW